MNVPIIYTYNNNYKLKTVIEIGLEMNIAHMGVKILYMVKRMPI